MRLALKWVCSSITRGIAPTYSERDSGDALIVGQSCQRPDGSFDLGRARWHTGEAPGKGRLTGGEVLINSTGTGTLGRVSLMESLPYGVAVFADTHVTLLRFLPGLAESRYMAYLLGLPSSRSYIEESLSVGATKQRELNVEALRAHKVAIGEIGDQRAVADFLDRECARIEQLGVELDAAIGDVRSLVGEMFDSHTDGAPRTRLRFAVDGIEQGWSPVCDSREVDAGEWGVLKLGCVNGGRFVDAHKALAAGLVERPELEVRTGDVLMSRANTRDLVGSCALVGKIRPRLMLSDLLYRLRIDDSRWAPEFVSLALGAARVRQEIRAVAAGAAGSMPKLNHGLVRNLTVPAIALDAQHALVARICEARRVPDAVAREYEATRAGLREYRDALITEAVTGQLDVTTLSDSRMSESLAAVGEGEPPEVLAG